jgi:hypothetical protein
MWFPIAARRLRIRNADLGRLTFDLLSIINGLGSRVEVNLRLHRAETIAQGAATMRGGKGGLLAGYELSSCYESGWFRAGRDRLHVGAASVRKGRARTRQRQSAG